MVFTTSVNKIYSDNCENICRTENAVSWKLIQERQLKKGNYCTCYFIEEPYIKIFKLKS